MSHGEMASLEPVCRENLLVAVNDFDRCGAAEKAENTGGRSIRTNVGNLQYISDFDSGQRNSSTDAIQGSTELSHHVDADFFIGTARSMENRGILPRPAMPPR